MALFEMHIFSEALGMQTTVNVVIPQPNTQGEIGVAHGEKRENYKCLYLLHGLSDDQSIWLRRTSIERYATRDSLCVVMPCGGRSFYTDMKYGQKYYTFIAEELPRLIEAYFPVSHKREDHFIAGLSMGGYGALKIGLRRRDYFCAAAGLSAVADIVARSATFPDTYTPIFGEDCHIPDEENLFKLTEALNNDPLRPRLYMGVGTEDYLYKDNQRLRAHLEKLDFDFTYRESAGSHNWEFWDEYIQYVLTWMFE